MLHLSQQSVLARNKQYYLERSECGLALRELRVGRLLCLHLLFTGHIIVRTPSGQLASIPVAYVRQLQLQQKSPESASKHTRTVCK